MVSNTQCASVGGGVLSHTPPVLIEHILATRMRREFQVYT